MKYLIFAISILVVNISCNKCEEVLLEPCGNLETNTAQCGTTVVTCYARNGSEPIGAIIDTRLNASAPRGDDWGGTVNMNHPANWIPDSIGQVFGIAIDRNENIYLASSDIYAYAGISIGGFGSSNATGPFPSGQIFKSEPPLYLARPFINLINTGDALNGIGNIVYDKWNNQLFATNLEDGKIYRIRMDGTTAETYDPWSPDAVVNGIVGQDERIWGIGANQESGQVKIYFPRITTSGRREIYSVALVGDAFPVIGSEQVEVSNVPGSQTIISDVAFSGDNTEMLLAERGDPHVARVISYTLIGSTWAFDNQFYIGNGLGRNAAGGVDFAYTEIDLNVSAECDEYFWASGNAMVADKITGGMYGIQGINTAGNNAASASSNPNRSTDLFIDFDGVYVSTNKRTIGDVEVIDCIRCGDPCDMVDYN